MGSLLRGGIRLRKKKISNASGLPESTIDHWQRKGILKPIKSQKTHCWIYSENDLNRIMDTIELKKECFTLDEIAKMLDDPMIKQQKLSQKIKSLSMQIEICKKHL